MLFNYNTLKVSIEPKTKSIFLKLNRPEHNNAFNTEMLFELESFFSWLTSHIEVNSVFISSTSDYFSKGIDHQEMQTWNKEQTQKFFLRANKLFTSLFYLPQSIIFDLKKGASNLGLEFALCGDIRLADNDASFSFDFTSKGLTPFCGATQLLPLIVNESTARKWLLIEDIEIKDLLNTNFLSYLYKNEMTAQALVEKLLNKIKSHSHIARIQTKRSFLERLIPVLEKANDLVSVSLATLEAEDWKKARESFTNVKDFAQQIS